MIFPNLSNEIQIILLFFGLLLAYAIITWVISLIDRKIPTAEVQSGWIRYFIDGPKTVLVIGLISVLFGILIINTPQSSNNIGVKLLGIIFTEFGFAFFIAFILHNTIEMHSRIENDRRISRGILSYLYGVKLDDKMFLAAEEHIFRSVFYRRGMKVEYDFLKINFGKAIIKYTVEYKVVNISEKSDSYEIVTFVEREANSECGDVKFDESIGLHRISINGRDLNENELREAKSSEQSDRNFLFSKYIIPLGAGEEATIKTVSFLEKCSRDSELWRSLSPTDGVELKVSWRPEMGLSFSVDPIHPHGAFDHPPHIEDGLLEAKISKPLFPQNGLHFWWSERAPQTDGGHD